MKDFSIYNNINKSLFFFLLIIIFIFHKPLFNPNLNLAGSDFKIDHVNWRQFAKEEILSGRLPLWNPYINSGQPFLAHPESALFYPPNLLYLILPTHYAMTLLVVFHIFVSFWGMRKLAQELTKSESGALAAGFIYSLSGYFAGNIYSGHLSSVFSASLFPVVFLLFYRAFIKVRLKNIILAAIAFSLLILSGYQENLVMFSLIVSLFFILLLFRREFRNNILTKIVALFLIFSLGIFLAAPQLIPSLEFVGRTTRAAGLPYEEAIVFSMEPSQLANLVNPNFYHKYLGSLYPFWEYLNYFGIAAILLVIIALITGFTNIIILSLALVGIFGFILSFGNNIPFGLYKILWHTIPIFKLFRIPSHYLLVTLFSVSLLSAYGFNKIKSASLRTFILILVFLSSLAFFKPFIMTDSNPTYPTNKELISAFSKFDKNYRFFHSYGAYTDWSNIMTLFDPNSAISERVESVKGSDPLLLKSYADFASIIDGRPIVPFSSRPIDVVIDNVTSPLLNLLSVKYFMMLPGEKDLFAIDPSRFRLLTSTDRFRLYENLDALAYGRIYYNIVGKSNREEVINYLRSSDFKYKEEVVVENISSRQFKKVGEPFVKIVSRQPGKTVYKIQTQTPGILMTGDLYYPGWKARINKKTDAPVVPVDLALTGVFVPSGNYQLELYFAPVSFKIGAAISFITILLIYAIYKKYGKPI